MKGTPITSATTIADLKQLQARRADRDHELRRSSRTSSARSRPPISRCRLAVAALNAGQVEGIIVDLPTALYMADPYVQEVKNSTVVGQFSPDRRAGRPTTCRIALQKGSPLTACVNMALAELKADGQLAGDHDQVALREDERRHGPRLHAVAERTHVGGGRGAGARRLPTRRPRLDPDEPRARRSSARSRSEGSARRGDRHDQHASSSLSLIVFVVLHSPNWPAFKQAFFNGEEFRRRFPEDRARLPAEHRVLPDRRAVILVARAVAGRDAIAPGPVFFPIRAHGHRLRRLVPRDPDDPGHLPPGVRDPGAAAPGRADVAGRSGPWWR